MPRRKTHEEFLEDIKNTGNGEYLVLSNYKNSSTKVRFRHLSNNCNNYEFEMKPNDFQQGHRCPVCSGKLKKTTDIFKNEIYNLVKDEYTVLDEYKNNSTKILMRHNCEKCNNYEWKITPKDFLHGYRCPKCAGNIKKTTDEFKDDVFNLVGNEYTVLGEYENSSTKILMRHNCCICNNYEYLVTPNTFKSNRRCPLCAKLKVKSEGISIIEKYLKDRDIVFFREKQFESCKFKQKLPFDVYIPELNLLIEFDGEQHFRNTFGVKSDFEMQMLRDKIKNKWCQKNNINLLRISYKELSNIDFILDNFINENYIFDDRDIYFQVNGFELHFGEYILKY